MSSMRLMTSLRHSFGLVFLALSAVVFSSCGYHVGGLKPEAMKDVSSIAVTMFENNSVEPRVGAVVSSTLATDIQKEGTYRLATYKDADARIEGKVSSVVYRQLRSSDSDSYRSTEVGLQLKVQYKVIDARTNKVLWVSSATAVSSLFDVGNKQSAKTNALYYAARLVSRDITSAIANG